MQYGNLVALHAHLAAIDGGYGEAHQLVKDVLATLESGDLKGKKIGSTWRIPRAALDASVRGSVGPAPWADAVNGTAPAGK